MNANSTQTVQKRAPHVSSSSRGETVDVEVSE